MLLPAEPPLDPDAEQARRLLRQELDSGTYQLQESVTSRVWRWFTDLFPDLGAIGPVPPWVTWALLGLVLAAVLAVLAFATRDRWRTARLTATSGTGAVLEGRRRTAEEHRQAARTALGAGDFSTALLEAYRALAVTALDRTLLDDRPGRTASEIAAALAAGFPAEAQALRSAADGFDSVRYGGRPAGEAQARAVLDLDDRLRRAAPVLDRSPAAAGTSFPVPR